MSSYTLYGPTYSTYVRTIRMLFAEKGIDYDQVEVDILAGEGQTPEHQNRHPFGKVPALDAGDIRLYETAAIAEFIEGRHPEHSFIPQSVEARALMRQWMSVIDNYGYPAIIGVLVWQRVVNARLGEPADEQAIETGMPAVHKNFQLLDDALDGSRYLAGEQASLADLYLAPNLAYVAMTPESEGLFGRYRNVSRWWDEMQARSSFVRTPYPG